MPNWASVQRWSKLLMAVCLSLSVFVRRHEPHEHLLNDAQRLPGQRDAPAERAGAGGGGRQLVERTAAAATLAVDEAAGVIDPHAASVAAAAGEHGYVKKAGPLDVRHWLPAHSEWRKEQRQGWEQDREWSLSQGSPPPPLPLLSSCQVFVNHMYKVIYLRHAKAASSSLLCHFSDCKRKGGGEKRSASAFEPLQPGAAADLEAMWRDYFVVTFVRNPYQRAVSSYKMMARQLSRAAAANSSFDWDQFCADPAGFTPRCAADPACSKKGPGFVYAHIEPQAPCVATASGAWAADFIGRVERMDEDLRAVLAEIERRRPADAPPIKPLEQSLANVNGRGCNETSEGRPHPVAKEQYCNPAEYYSGKHAACYEAVRRHYATDIEQLRFEPPVLDRSITQREAAGRRWLLGAG